MRVLLDECIDWRLSRDIVGHDVKTAQQMGWATIKNGDLLASAVRSFDAFVTVDQNLSYQQNLSSYSIAVIVLRAKSNRLAALRPLIPQLLDALASARPGIAVFVGESETSSQHEPRQPERQLGRVDHQHQQCGHHGVEWVRSRSIRPANCVTPA